MGVNDLTLSTAGAALIKGDEGCKYEAYHGEEDPPGVWTICYGHTYGVHEGMTATPPLCDWYFQQDMAPVVSTVNACVAVPLTQNQFDALVSLTEEIGTGAFARSTLLKVLNTGDYDGAAAHFKDWKYSDGHVDNGMVLRRQREVALFKTPDQPAAEETA